MTNYIGKAKKLLIVSWTDSAVGPEGWEFLEDLGPLLPCRCTSIGYLIEDTEEYITLAGTISETQILGRLTIPKGCIKKTEEFAERRYDQ